MSIPDPRPANPPARNLEAGLLLIAAGAILLFVSLFLDWFDPGLDAWTSFEVWDLVLAVLAVGALVAIAGRLGYGPPRPSSWLLVPSALAFVIVVFAIINHPPAASLAEQAPATGLWLALAATVLMVAGTVLSVARISVALNVAGPPAGAHTPPEPHAPPPPTEPTSRL
jgi:peptidoglycan/LPS O-acetylase OafA/YrhL